MFCFCLALTVSPFAQSQVAPAAAPQKQSAQPVRPDIGRFYGFCEHVGEEDDEIQGAILDGNVPTIHRQDYATEIGISEGEGQTMLAILLDAYSQGGGGDEHKNITRYKLVQQYGPDEGQRRYDEEAATYKARSFPALQEAVVKLQTELGEESFAKLNEYVRKELWSKGAWVGGKGWVKEPKDPNPCPPNDNPPPGQTTHLACIGFYADFFHEIARMDANNRIVAANDKAEMPTGYLLPIDLPEDKKQAAIEIAVEADRESKENAQKYVTEGTKVYSQNVAKYGVVRANQIPDPPEIEALNKNGQTIIEEHIFMLRQALGEDYFKRFDAELSQRNKTITLTTPEPSPSASSAPQKTPAVQP
jgi:hypothetical protein